MDYLLGALVFVLTWVGSVLLLQAWFEHRNRPSLAERLAPFQPYSIADEAQQWLRHQEQR